MEFLTEVATPLISVVGTIIVCLINNFVQMRKRDIEQDKHIDEIKNEFSKQITDVKNEFNKQITSVKTELREQIFELSAAYQQSQAVIACQIAELDKKQEVHNKVIERVYKCEGDIKRLEERTKKGA